MCVCVCVCVCAQGVNGEKVVGQAPELGDYFKRIPKDIIQVESGDF